MIWIFIYQLAVIWLAYLNSLWSNPEDEHKIKHWLNGLVHLVISFLIGYIYEWNFGLANLIFTRIVFDTSYNIFMKNGLGYVSSEPESIIDKIEKWIVLKTSGWIYKKNISENDIERIAIEFRILILITAIILLFI